MSLALAVIFNFDDLSTLWRADFRTGTGEIRLVTLEDGSQVQLRAKSAIAVNYQHAQRRLTLLDGEAWFQAAPNAARPFVVEAAGGTVTALGTAFDIALENAHADVAVTVHRVAVASGGETVIVTKGQHSSFGPRSRKPSRSGRHRQRHRLAARQFDLCGQTTRRSRGGARALSSRLYQSP